MGDPLEMTGEEIEAARTGKPIDAPAAPAPLDPMDEYSAAEVEAGVPFEPKGPAKLYAWNPDNELMLIPTEDAPKATAAGWRVEQPEESIKRIYKEKLEAKYSGARGAFEATGAALARGVIPGADLLANLDPMAKKTGYMSAEHRKELKDYWKLLSLGVEVGGSVAGMGQAAAGLGRGTTSLIARAMGQQAAEKAATSIVKQGLIRGAAGAVEGAFMGTGHVVNEQALGNPVDVSQKLLMATGVGAALGGAFGMGGALFKRAQLKRSTTQAVNEALIPTGPGVADEAADVAPGVMSSWFKEFGRERALKAAGFLKGSMKKLTQPQQQDMGKFLLNYTLKHGDDAGARIVEMGDDVASVARKLASAKNELGESLGKVYKTLDGLGAGAPDLERVRKSVYSRGPGGLGDDLRELLRGPRKDAEKAIREVKDVLDQPGLGFEQLHSIRMKLDRSIYKAAIGRAPDRAKNLVKIRRIMEDEIERAGDLAAKSSGYKEFLPSYKALKRAYGNSAGAHSVAEGAAAGLPGNRFVSPSDYAMAISGALGSSMGEGVTLGAGLKGAALGIGHKILRERGSSVAARVLDHLGNLGAMQRSIVSADKLISKSVATALGSAAGKASKAIPAASLLAAVSFGGNPGSTRGLKGYKARMSELEDIMADPAAYMEMVQLGLADVQGFAPDNAGALSMKQMEIAQFCYSMAPRPPKNTAHTLQPHMVDWEPTKTQIDTWARYVKAATNPASVLEDLRAWRVTPEAIYTLRKLYPALYAQASQEIAEQAAEMKKQLPYDQRVKLSMWFGTPADPSMAPEAIRWLQSNYKQQKPKGRAPGGMRFQGLDEITFGQQALSPGQGGTEQ